jgi:hypothetical protein
MSSPRGSWCGLQEGADARIVEARVVTMADQSAESIRYFTLPEYDNTDDDSGQQGQSDGTGLIRVVEIRCYPDLDRTFHPGSQQPDRSEHESARPLTADYHARWVLERTVIPVPSSDVSYLIGVEAVDEYLAEKIIDPAFEVISDMWIVHDPGGFDAVAQADYGMQRGLHRLLLGDRTRAVCGELGVPGPGADVAGGIAAEIRLPIDGPLNFIKLLLQVAGMAVGMLVGLPVLTTACCKSFLHDQLTRMMARGIGAAIRDLAAVDDSRPGPTAPTQWLRACTRGGVVARAHPEVLPPPPGPLAANPNASNAAAVHQHDPGPQQSPGADIGIGG